MAKFFRFLKAVFILLVIAIILSIPILKNIIFILIVTSFALTLFIYGAKKFFDLNLIKGVLIMFLACSTLYGLVLLIHEWIG